MAIETRAAYSLASVEVSPLEAAYLAEGVPRVIGATLAGLAHMGLIEFRSDRKVVPLKPPPSGSKDPIQQSVIDFVSKSKHPSSVEDIRKHAEPATEPVRDALRASGLLLDERARWTGGLAIGSGVLTACILLLGAANGGISANSVWGGLFVALIPTLYIIERRRRT